jgi:hypothetical protein
MKKIPTHLFQHKNMVDDHRIVLDLWNTHQVSGLNFFYNFKDIVNNVYVIEGAKSDSAINSATKLKLNTRLFKSLNLKLSVDEQYRETLDITSVVLPDEYKDYSWINHVKLMNHALNYEQVTRILDHMILWYNISTIGEPTIILEHNAVLHHRIKNVMPRNSIIALANGQEFYRHNDNWLCMNGVYAYAVDQFSAKALFDEVMSNGIIEPLDLMFRLDKYSIIVNNIARKIA